MPPHRSKEKESRACSRLMKEQSKRLCLRARNSRLRSSDSVGSSVKIRQSRRANPVENAAPEALSRERQRFSSSSSAASPMSYSLTAASMDIVRVNSVRVVPRSASTAVDNAEVSPKPISWDVIRVTLRPVSASVRAHKAPVTPPPITHTSQDCSSLSHGYCRGMAAAVRYGTDFALLDD